MPTPIFITGATSGIGKAIAQRMMAEGHQVLAWVRDASRTEQLPAGCVAVGFADLADLEATAAAAEQLAQHYSQLGGIVLAAGYLPNDAAFHEVAHDELLRIHNINLLAPQVLLKHLAPCVQWGGCVVLLGSISGHKGSYCDAYAAAKAGVHALVRSVALKLAPRGVRVVGLAPGITDNTGMTDALKPGLREKTLNSSVPLGVASQPEQLAGWVSFLMGPDSASLTGAVIDINGGQYMRT